MCILIGASVIFLALGWGTDLNLLATVASVFAAVLAVVVGPLYSLPSLAFVLLAFLPAGYLSFLPTGLARYYAPAVLVMFVWGLRTAFSRDRRPRPSRATLALAGSALAVVLLVASLAGLDTSKSLLWSAVFAITTILPFLFASERSVRWQSLIATVLVCASILGVIAILESTARASPLAPFMTFEQHWSVYRVITLLGHPLFNGTFFAAVGTLAFAVIFWGGARRYLSVVAFALSSLGVVLSGSRSGVLAWAIGIAIVLVFVLMSGRMPVGLKILGIGVLGLAFAVFSNVSIFAQRASSEEAAESGDYRAEVVDLAFGLLARRPLGSGPGTSADVATAAGAALPLENALLGALVSLGFIGAVAVLLFLLSGFVTLWVRSRILAIAPIVAFLAAGGAFPLWETNPASLSLIGILIMIGLSAEANRGPAQASSRPSG